MKTQNGLTTKFRSEYFSYCRMIARCNNPKDCQYKNYGARGINVCARWDSFILFMDDMGAKPSLGYTIERIDNNGNYEPKNCKWIKISEQSLNTRRSRKITYKGETLTMSEWARRLKINKQTILERIKRGYSTSQALSIIKNKQLKNR